MLEKHDDGRPKVIYSRRDLGMLFSERESLMKLDRVTHDDGSHTNYMYSVDHPDYPEGDHAIRTKMFQRQTIKQIGNDIQFTSIANFSMGGYVPASLMNMMIGTMFSKGMDRMMEKVEKYK